jgi:hypothetical protein
VRRSQGRVIAILVLKNHVQERRLIYVTEFGAVKETERR